MKTQDIPLFPLQAVLFPGGVVSLPVIEARHLDVIARSAKTDTGIGLVLAEEDGRQLTILGRSAPNIARVGCLCRVLDFDQDDAGQLKVTLIAERKFKVLNTYEGDDRALFGEVLLLAPEPVIATGPEDESMVDVLEHLLSHPGVAPEAKQTGYGHLADLGGRLAELLPLKNAVRQRMLEINDPVTRLNHLEKLLDQMQATAEAQGA
jgi:Lon protease-like protein